MHSCLPKPLDLLMHVLCKIIEVLASEIVVLEMIRDYPFKEKVERKIHAPSSRCKKVSSTPWLNTELILRLC